MILRDLRCFRENGNPTMLLHQDSHDAVAEKTKYPTISLLRGAQSFFWAKKFRDRPTSLPTTLSRQKLNIQR